jgi:hypothetical protein
VDVLTRKWLMSLTCFALLVVAAPFAVLWLWPERNDARECFDQIRLGMPAGEAERLLHGAGFKHAPGGGVSGGEAILLYRQESGHSIILAFRPQVEGVAAKDFQPAAREGLLERLRRLFIGR